MPIAEVVDALQGFAGAYGKIASQEGRDVHHELRVSAIEPGSFSLFILAWVSAIQLAGPLQTIETLGGAAHWVVSQIASVIAAKKHTHGQPYGFNITGDHHNIVVITNNNGLDLSVPIAAFEAFKEKLIDSDLNKIAEPLQRDIIDAAEIKTEGGGETIEATITSEERESFRPPESTVTSKETEITGTLVSLNKENNRGLFRLGSGKSVRYRYAGPNPESFHTDFSHHGAVRVKCIASFDENLDPTHLDIVAVEHLQRRLPLS